MKVPKSTPYENNPFNIGLTGLRLLFDNAKNIAVFAIILAAVGLLVNTTSNAIDIGNAITMTDEQAAAQRQAEEKAVQDFMAMDPGAIAVAGILIASLVFLFLAISLWINGVLEYTGARLAAGEKVGLKEAFATVGKDLASYIWLYVLLFVRILLWSLLFIIPGIIMAVRYSLAGTAFFAEGKRGNAAIARSLELTENAWLTTFAGAALWNLMTLGLVTSVLQPGINATLYRQYVAKEHNNQPKPPAHWLSWVTLIAPLALFALILTLALFVALIVIVAGQ